MTSTVLVEDLKGNIFGCNTYLPSLIAIDFVTCEVIVVVVVGDPPLPLSRPQKTEKKNARLCTISIGLNIKDFFSRATVAGRNARVLSTHISSAVFGPLAAEV